MSTNLIHKESVKVKPCYYFWLGLKLKNKIPKIWTDGTTVDFGKTDMTPWDKGEPNNANPQENCVVMYGYSEALGKWNDLSCDKVDEWEAISGMVCKTVAT
uniref:C-type lectin domain-containing protein n=1 Tax=Acrobeloides nanus TaxID=290746 RepID=A0A914CFF2_9BILA